MGKQKRRQLAAGIIKDNANDSNDDDNEKANIYWALTVCQALCSEMYIFALSYLILATTLWDNNNFSLHVLCGNQYYKGFKWII